LRRKNPALLPPPDATIHLRRPAVAMRTLPTGRRSWLWARVLDRSTTGTSQPDKRRASSCRTFGWDFAGMRRAAYRWARQAQCSLTRHHRRSMSGDLRRAQSPPRVDGDDGKIGSVSCCLAFATLRRSSGITLAGNRVGWEARPVLTLSGRQNPVLATRKPILRKRQSAHAGAVWRWAERRWPSGLVQAPPRKGRVCESPPSHTEPSVGGEPS
jgi:hypothetical protein